MVLVSMILTMRRKQKVSPGVTRLEALNAGPRPALARAVIAAVVGPPVIAKPRKPQQPAAQEALF